MKKFTIKLKRKLLTTFGILNPNLPKTENFEFESKICELAGIHLKATGLNHFNYLFLCESSYARIAQKTGIADDIEYSKDTVERTSNRIVNKLFEEARNDSDFKRWMMKKKQLWTKKPEK